MSTTATLHPTSPLPEGWSPLEIVEDTIVADGLELYRAGVASVGPEGEEVTGSGAETGAAPVRRSHFELLERVATLEALRSTRPAYDVLTEDGRPAGWRAGSDVFPESVDPARWRYARSNGVALHADWKSACSRARWELVERDRVLRSWYGETRPERLRFPAGPFAATKSYDWMAYAFPAPIGESSSAEAEVVGVFGFPGHRAAPLAMGFSCRPTAEDALVAASTEAMQLLAFMWGETPPDTSPEMGPTAGHHLDRFQWPGRHAHLRRWLEGAHLAYGSTSPARGRGTSTGTVFVDLTPRWLGGGLRVAKAVCPSATPLMFGDSPLGAHLPDELRAHPLG